MTPLQSEQYWQLLLQQDNQLRQMDSKREPPNNQNQNYSQQIKFSSQNQKSMVVKEQPQSFIYYIWIQNKEKLLKQSNMKTDQEALLFEQHRHLGNRWQQIAMNLGYDDHNQVKNKFYSTLRKGIRKFNRFIYLTRKQTARNQQHMFKELKPEFLTKLTAIADRHYQQKYEVKQPAIDSASDIQSKMIDLARSDQDFQGNWDDEKEDLLALHAEVQMFNRNCKKRKGGYRKKDQKSENSLSDMEEEEQSSEKLQSIKGKDKGKAFVKREEDQDKGNSVLKMQAQQTECKYKVKQEPSQSPVSMPAKEGKKFKGKGKKTGKDQGKGIGTGKESTEQAARGDAQLGRGRLSLSDILQSQEMGEMPNLYDIQIKEDLPMMFSQSKETPNNPMNKSTGGILLPSPEIQGKNLGFAKTFVKNSAKFGNVHMSSSMSVSRRDSDPLRMNMSQGSCNLKHMAKIIESKDISGESLITSVRPRQQVPMEQGQKSFCSLMRQVSSRSYPRNSTKEE